MGASRRAVIRRQAGAGDSSLTGALARTSLHAEGSVDCWEKKALPLL